MLNAPLFRWFFYESTIDDGLNHCRSPSMRLTSAIGVPRIRFASRVTRSKRSSGSVSRIFRFRSVSRRSNSSTDVAGLIFFCAYKSDLRAQWWARFDPNRQHAVKPGETLSGIAERYLGNGVTMNQMMIALFQSNPQAFSNNINVLRQGATLHIPDENELRLHTPEMATAEVVRQTKAWQTGYEQHVKLAMAHANVMASSDEPIN